MCEAEIFEACLLNLASFASWEPLACLPLLENTIVIAKTITPGRVLESGKRIHVAGSQATETAIAQSSIDLGLDDIFHSEAKLFNALCWRFCLFV